MKLSFSPEDEKFRSEVKLWLTENLVGEFEQVKFRGGPGDEHMFPEIRKKWENSTQTKIPNLKGCVSNLW